LVLLITLAALGLSYLVNKFLLKLLEEYAAIIGAPVFEEIFKTLPAYYWNRPVFHVHFLFGVGEALYDFATSGRDSGRWAAVFSIISHSIFGAVTSLVIRYTGMVIPALVSAIVIHCAWNLFVIRLVNRDKEGC
jgi:hypothetical protein